MKLRFLGTGTSFGIPVAGCGCVTCTSADPRDRRTRHGALLEDGGTTLLVDTPPELRLQLVAARVGRVDAVWYTHCHADHTHGVDDLRAFSVRRSGALPVYAGRDCAAILRSRFDYVFDPTVQPLEGTTKPDAELRILEPFRETEIAGMRLLPVPVPHGSVETLGFRAGGLGYITDAKRLPEGTREALAGVRVLVLNALWYGRPHPTHFNVEEAVAEAARIGAERTYLTHLSHHVRHAELERDLPAGVFPAYDGLCIEI